MNNPAYQKRGAGGGGIHYNAGIYKRDTLKVRLNVKVIGVTVLHKTRRLSVYCALP